MSFLLPSTHAGIQRSLYERLLRRLAGDESSFHSEHMRSAQPSIVVSIVDRFRAKPGRFRAMKTSADSEKTRSKRFARLSANCLLIKNALTDFLPLDYRK